jgi:mycoredoxin
MLNVYAVEWCPHCQKTVEFLKENQIDFNYIDIEASSDSIVQKVVEMNGGEEWVVPTLEYKGIWREGKAFDADELQQDLKEMGVIGISTQGTDLKKGFPVSNGE